MLDPLSFKGLDIFFWKTCFCWRAVGEGQCILISKGEFKCAEVTKKLFVKTFYGWADRWTLLIESNRTQYHKEFALEGRGEVYFGLLEPLVCEFILKKTSVWPERTVSSESAEIFVVITSLAPQLIVILGLRKNLNPLLIKIKGILLC